MPMPIPTIVGHEEARGTPPSVVIRVLPPEEWDRLRTFPDFLGGLPDPSHWRIIVAEDAGQILAYNCLYEAVHAEPLWIRPDHRHHAHLFRDLWRVTKQTLEEAGVDLVHVCVPDTLPGQQRLVEKFGGIPAPGKLYLLEIGKAAL